MKTISIIVPVYNEEKALSLFHEELCKTINTLPYYSWEILMVNDGSSDDSLTVIKSLASRDSRISYLDLSRNFGKECAMLAGIDHVNGDCAIIMDADLQHPPHIIKQLISEWEAGYDDIYAKRTARTHEPILRRLMTSVFYKLINKLSKTNMLPGVGDFRLLDKKCITILRNIRENERYSKGLFSWIGFKKKCVEYEQAERITGKSSMNYRRLFKLAFNGLFSFSTAPLKVASVTGIIVSVTAFIYMIYVFVKALLCGDPVAGYPTLMTVILFLGGMILMCLGIIGEYVGRIYSEVKQRPVYIVREYGKSK